MGRLNDTMALASRPASPGVERTVDVKKIDNGYVTRTSEYNSRTGKYTCAEEYSKDPPGSSGRSGGSVGPEGLADTKRYLGDNV